MKKLITVLILLALLTALVVVYAIVSHKNSEKAAETTVSAETSVIEITKSDADDITAISYNYNDRTISLVLHDGTQWKVDGDAAYPLDVTKPEAMAEAIASVSAYRLIEENASNLKQYGLDSPKYTIKVSYKNDTSLTYHFGSYISFTDTYYMILDGKNDVYTVPKTLLASFAYELSDMQALDSVPEIDTDSITAVKIESPGGSAFEMTPSEEESGTWISGGDSFDTEKASDIVSEICNLPLKTLAAYGDHTDDELAAFGFDPEHQITVTISFYETVTIPAGDDTSSTSGTKKLPRTFSFRIGSAVPEADPAAYYVLTSLSSLIYQIPSSDLSALIG